MRIPDKPHMWPHPYTCFSLCFRIYICGLILDTFIHIFQGCFLGTGGGTNISRALQYILSKCVYCRNRTSYENFKLKLSTCAPFFGHMYKVSVWNSHHKCDFWHALYIFARLFWRASETFVKHPPGPPYYSWPAPYIIFRQIKVNLWLMSSWRSTCRIFTL